MPSMMPSPPWAQMEATTPLTVSQTLQSAREQILSERASRIPPPAPRDPRRLPPAYTVRTESSETPVSAYTYGASPYYGDNDPYRGWEVSSTPKPKSKLLPGHPLYKKGLRVGSIVRVVKKITRAPGWINAWVREMDAYVGNGQTYRVGRIASSGVELEGVRCRFPEESLQVVFDEDV